MWLIWNIMIFKHLKNLRLLQRRVCFKEIAETGFKWTKNLPFNTFIKNNFNLFIIDIPWVPETFLAAFGQHRRFSPDARKTSGTQGIIDKTRSYLLEYRRAALETFLSTVIWVKNCLFPITACQPRPQGAFPWLWWVVRLTACVTRASAKQATY